MEFNIDFDSSFSIVIGFLLLNIVFAPIVWFIILNLKTDKQKLKTPTLTLVRRVNTTQFLDNIQVALASTNLVNILLLMFYLKLEGAWENHLDVIRMINPKEATSSLVASLFTGGLIGAVMTEFALLAIIALAALVRQLFLKIRGTTKLILQNQEKPDSV